MKPECSSPCPQVSDTRPYSESVHICAPYLTSVWIFSSSARLPLRIFTATFCAVHLHWMVTVKVDWHVLLEQPLPIQVTLPDCLNMITGLTLDLPNTKQVFSSVTLGRSVRTATELNESSRSYVTTDGQSASLFWGQAPIWGPRPEFFTFKQLQFFRCVAPFVTRERVCRLQLLLVLASAVILGCESFGTHAQILISQTRDSPNLEDHVSVFISPRNTVAQSYSQLLGSIFFALYDSQVYGLGIRSRFQSVLSINIILFQTAPHRKHITPSLQSPTG
jgi:hypothetical protein